MKVSDLNPNPKNPRKITNEKLLMLKKAIEEFGDLSGIVFNRKTKQIVGGHQRAKLIPPEALITIERKFPKATKNGTVAEGYIEFSGERFSYREVSWDETREKAANIAANKGAGDWNMELLGEWMRDIDSFGLDLDLTLFDDDERKDLLMPSLGADFEAGSAGDQGKLDEKKRVDCPECGHRFTPGWT